MANHSSSFQGHHNMTKGLCRVLPGLCQVLPGQPEVAVLWLCIPNLLHNFFQNCAV
jgi:hypothetical protein